MKRICSRCRATFEWPVTFLPEGKSLSSCLDETEKRFIRSHYADCICLDCLLHIKETFYSFDIPENYQHKK
ncbi:hypothetical protein [uncultured Parabacteroides sp.]|uniref:hypothetical protein n=1 Tax=uncultured Parabacteroides sp. TaxID=512312 RepID=UPI00263058CE|nr:hypothetical protein [uncultured Parabacteroides sp.]